MPRDGRTVNELRDLLLSGLDHVGVAMTDIIDCNSHREIEVFITLNVVEVAALCLLSHNRKTAVIGWREVASVALQPFRSRQIRHDKPSKLFFAVFRR